MKRFGFLFRPQWLALYVVVAAFAWLCFTVLAPWQLGKNTTTSRENTQIAKDVFDRVLEDITTWTVLDPEFWWAQRSLDGQPEGAIVDHDEIYALRIQVSWYDNGWFPSGELSYFRKDRSRLLVSSPADRHGEIVSVVDDGDLGPQLAELGGSYRHDSDWTLVVTRDGHYGELSEFDD